MSALASPSRDRRSVRLWAWALGLVVILIYVGYYVWSWLRGTAAQGS